MASAAADLWSIASEPVGVAARGPGSSELPQSLGYFQTKLCSELAPSGGEMQLRNYNPGVWGSEKGP